MCEVGVWVGLKDNDGDVMVGSLGLKTLTQWLNV